MTKRSLGQLQNEIGEAVAAARRKEGLTQQALARALRTRQANISRIERGLQNLSLDLLVRLGDALDRKLTLSFHRTARKSNDKHYHG